MARRPLNRKASTAGARPVMQRRTRRRRGHGVEDGQLVDIDLGENLVIGKLAGNYEANYFRYAEYTHISDLIYKCNRMIALSYRTDTKIHGETLYDSQAMCFAIGKVIEQYIVGKIVKHHGAEVYGRWTCRCDDTEEELVGQVGLRPSGTCSKCHSPYGNYDELFLKNDEYMISGSADLTLLLANSLYFTEIKSMKHEYWLELDRPKPEHLIQVLFYWWLAKEAGLSVHNQLSLLYVSKNYMFKSPYKEFIVNPEEEIHKLAPYLEEAMELKQSRYDEADMPPRTCAEAISPAAKKCEMCTLCFGWDDNGD